MYEKPPVDAEVITDLILSILFLYKLYYLVNFENIIIIPINRMV
jgi:hypothetical protein